MADLLDNLDLKENYGLVIMTGTEKLLEFPERKEPLNFEWLDKNGTHYDLDEPYFKKQEVTLSCAIMADNDSQFWMYYNAFFERWKLPHIRLLFIDDHSRVYKCFYRKTSNFKKSLKRLKNVPKVFVKFDLTIEITE